MISGNLLIMCISFMTKFGHFQTQVNSFDLDVCVANRIAKTLNIFKVL
jgi:hypothetical protein